jgi:hypothetical protein
MTLYASGQQPFTTTRSPSNVLTAKFTMKKEKTLYNPNTIMKNEENQNQN